MYYNIQFALVIGLWSCVIDFLTLLFVVGNQNNNDNDHVMYFFVYFVLTWTWCYPFLHREADMTKERIEKLLKAGANVVLTTKGIDDMALKVSICELCFPMLSALLQLLSNHRVVLYFILILASFWELYVVWQINLPIIGSADIHYLDLYACKSMCYSDLVIIYLFVC